MIRYITLDETGSFEKIEGKEPVRLVGGLIIDEEEGTQYKSEIRKLLISVCDSFNELLKKEGRNCRVVYPKSLHLGDKMKTLYEQVNGRLVPIDTSNNNHLNVVISRFRNHLKKQVLEYIEVKIKNGGKIKIYNYIYPNIKIINEDSIQTNILNSEIGSNLYEKMAILSMMNNVFGRLDTVPDTYSFQYATRVYSKSNMDDKTNNSFNNLYSKIKTEKDILYVITSESTYKSALSERLYELPIDSVFNKINYDFNVTKIMYDATDIDSETPFHYISDIICGYLRDCISGKSNYGGSGVDIKKLCGLPDCIETRIYSNTDRLYTLMINNLKKGNISEYYSSYFDYVQHKSEYKELYDSRWIAEADKYLNHIIGTDKEFQNIYIYSLNEYYSFCEKLMTSKSDYLRGSFIARKIIEDLKKLNDPLFGKRGRSAFLNERIYRENMFRFNDLILRGINHQGAVRDAEEIIKECEKYKYDIGVEEYIEHKLRVVQYMFNSFQYNRIKDVYLKDILGRYSFDRWEESPIEKLKNALQELSNSVNESFGNIAYGYMIAGKIYSTLAQAYSFIACSDKKKTGYYKQAQNFFEKALKEMEHDRENRNITLSFKVHLYLDMEDKDNFEKCAAEYFEMDKFNYEEAGKTLMRLINSDSDVFRFALYIYVKAIRVFYVKEDLNKARSIYMDLYRWMSQNNLLNCDIHPWELIYINMYDVVEYMKKKNVRNELINRSMIELNKQILSLSTSDDIGPTITAIIADFKLRTSDIDDVMEILSYKERMKLREIECLAEIDKWNKGELCENLSKMLSYMYN